MKRNQSIDFEMQGGRSGGGQCLLLESGRQISPAGDGKSETTRNVERSIAYMREHINKPLQVATLAAFANVSPSHFFALFKQLTGFPPMDYFTRLRMRHACQLLDSTPASVKEVAAALGYDDPFYFSRVFKAVNHVPPSRYRSSQTQLPNVMGSRSVTVTLRAESPARAETL